MGLFSNKNKPCPLCGKATPRLLATKIQDDPICSDCSGGISAEDEIRRTFRLEDLRAHLEYRAANKQAFDALVPTRTVTDDGLKMLIDDKKRVFAFQTWADDNPPIFLFDSILGYELYQDDDLVESWQPGAPYVPYTPALPDTLLGDLAMIARALSQDDDDRRNERYYSMNFRLMLQLDNPWWHTWKVKDQTTSGYSYEFQNRVNREFAEIRNLCNAIASCGGAAVATVPGGAPLGAGGGTAAAAEDAADGIKKFKELLDAGIINQEEFDAKKKQLLGI